LNEIIIPIDEKIMCVMFIHTKKDESVINIINPEFKSSLVAWSF